MKNGRSGDGRSGDRVTGGRAVEGAEKLKREKCREHSENINIYIFPQKHSTLAYVNYIILFLFFVFFFPQMLETNIMWASFCVIFE